MKTCFKCKVQKPLDEFYVHRQMGDGHLGKCKECTKADVKKNYADNREQRALYERLRFQRPERKRKIAVYQRQRRQNNPIKYKAHNMTSHAVRGGILAKKQCEKCGNPQSQAHHDDYAKPLNVNWLCRGCHLEVHGKSAYAF